MCGGAVLAPLAILGSLIGGRQKYGSTQSYTPQEVDIPVNNPEPGTEEPTLGINNSDNSANAAKKGKAVLKIDRNPGIGVPTGGRGGSGVNVVGT